MNRLVKAALLVGACAYVSGNFLEVEDSLNLVSQDSKVVIHPVIVAANDNFQSEPSDNFLKKKKKEKDMDENKGEEKPKKKKKKKKKKKEEGTDSSSSESSSGDSSGSGDTTGGSGDGSF